MFNLSNVDEKNVHLVSSLVLAYIGDSVYEVYVRTKVINEGFNTTNVLHHKSTEYVKAGAQARKLELIYDKLTEEEKEIVRRGKNAKSNTIPKNANIADYKKATALEALIGYLFLSGKQERLDEIIGMVIKE